MERAHRLLLQLCHCTETNFFAEGTCSPSRVHCHGKTESDAVIPWLLGRCRQVWATPAAGDTSGSFKTTTLITELMVSEADEASSYLITTARAVMSLSQMWGSV